MNRRTCRQALVATVALLAHVGADIHAAPTDAAAGYFALTPLDGESEGYAVSVVGSPEVALDSKSEREYFAEVYLMSMESARALTMGELAALWCDDDQGPTIVLASEITSAMDGCSITTVDADLLSYAAWMSLSIVIAF